MQMMLFALSVVTTLANPTHVGIEELNIAMNPDTSSMLQIPLLMDSFNKLDRNHDGVLNKEERKPLKMGMYLTAATLYREGDHVTREQFVQHVSVPDFAGHEGNERQCIQEDAIVETDPEDLWTVIAGESAWMTVSDFADALYEISEMEFDLDYAGFQAFAVGHTYPENFHAEDKFSLVKLSDYTESHNANCQANAVARRRKLFVEWATITAAVSAAAMWVGRAIAIAGVGAVAECGVQGFMHWAFPHGWLHQLYDEGCTWNALATDFMFNLGAQAFSGVGLWGWGVVTNYFGWGGAAATVTGSGTGLGGIELGVPLLQNAGTQTVSQGVNAGVQAGVNTVSTGIQAIGGAFGISL